jgi:hypothetical protein
MRRLGFCVLAAVTFSLGAALFGAAPVWAAQPWWHLSSGSRPSELAPGSDGEVVVTAENLGDATAHGECVQVANTGSYTDSGCTEAAAVPGTGDFEEDRVRIADTLPSGWRALGGIAGVQPAPGGAPTETVALSCSPSALSCEASAPLAPYDQIEVRIEVEVPAGASTSGALNTLSVSGGNTPSAQLSRPLAVGGGPSRFGVEDYELTLEEEGGGEATQAGSHPFQATGTIALDQGPDTASSSSAPQTGPVVPARDIVARLPAGLIADPGTAQRCLEWQLLVSDGLGKGPECSAPTAVGVASVTADQPGGAGTFTVATPIFNIEPEAGEPARFGFFVPVVNVPVLLDTGVRSGPGEDWGVDLSAGELPRNAGLISARVTFWGVPRRASHDDSRGWGCLQATRGRAQSAYEPCENASEELHPPAFVTLPTSCTGPLRSSIEVESWDAPGRVETFGSSVPLQALTGCGALAFTPRISTEPTTHAAASPSGFAFDLSFDMGGLTTAGELAQSDLRQTVVMLPEGVTVDPSAGVGLGGCTQAQYAQVTLGSVGGVGCPEDSKLGTVEIETPLLFTTVYGSLYLAQPYGNPFGEPGHPGGSLLAVYVIARSRAERGVLVKLAGKIVPNPVTGQLTISFENDPQLPFEHFNFHFREGQQAPLITPQACGTYTTQAALTPFSEPASVLQDISSFQITSGSEGSACPVGNVAPFAPAITAQTLNDDAGVFSPLSVELTRTDAMSEIASYSTDLSSGLTANLTGVPFCPEADVELARRKTGAREESEPSCPETSLIGHTIVGVGVGSVLDYVPGKLYFAGPFHGDPFSIVSVISAVVGPFDLGTVVIRFGLRIDPYTAQVSIDPSGSEPIPTIIDGIVTHVRDIRVSIDRAAFTLNPTTCTPLPLSSTLTSAQGQVATVSAPFQAVNCGELSFKPKFTASTRAKTSKANGASLSVRLTMPGTLGAQSNIRQVKVDLPRQLPSRLTTLQQACTEAQFNANPAACPAASKIGYARTTTPILPVPLTGPAIFVSHGGEAFPSLILVLQGYGVTIDLVGATYISPQGITSTTFKTVPDEPVGGFELTLPQGPYSALAALENLCKVTNTITVKKKVTVRVHGHNKKVTRRIKETESGLRMPTSFIAQNGAVTHQNTPISVTGCPNSIAVISHSLKGRNLTVSVSVPATGKLKANGKDLSSASKTVNGRETVTLKLHTTKSGKFATKLEITFTPTKGKKQGKTITVSSRR